MAKKVYKLKGGKKKEWSQVGFQKTPMTSFDKPGQELAGTYRGSRLVEKTGSLIHSVIVDGELKNFWGSGLLDYLLKDVKAGTDVKVVFKGKQKVKITYKGKDKKSGKVKNITGNREVRQYEVYTR